MNKPFLILADGIDDTQRSLIHKLVKSHARGWWHQFLDAWIVYGHSARFWRDELRRIVGSGSSILVLSLPDEGKRSWASYGANSKVAWLKKYYTASRSAESTPKSGD